ncbi:Predicted kinase, aminoglycoside phosphotransferase (APT) family [Lentibacillus persicus]|uniref:Predicted kinase, aminoglycoside phosphotransferase (APT) family n=1 Tax=Lentibacillus persicus TaxID=640948 RepID=A0A1I1SI72_9BACI|nr:phosphotransferase family protein [Lentibacillus persicus]SFD43553.1 Predicted kinase, aminoglycoside phosphotransferase (APT) family [Lentibacillus persicus]
MQKQKNDTIDWQKIETYIRNHITDLSKDEEMSVKKFTEGYSNLTYMVKIGEWEAVLRRPPFGYIPPKAHDMEREYRIIEKIHPVYPLAPKPYMFCEDTNIMDKHFYIMEKKNGIVIDAEIPEAFKEIKNAGKDISEAVISALIDLQNIDVDKNGLHNLGKPEGFVERQVYGWKKRFERSRTDDLIDLKDLETWLINHIPSNREVSIVHNDFKLNNMMFEKGDPGKIIGVFDWELSTIGDPLTDLGSSLVYWTEEGDPDMGLTSVTDEAGFGFYSRRDFLERYAQICGRDVSDVNFYLTLGFYKLAGILQQLYYRWKIGEVKDDRFSTLNQGIAHLLEMAEEAKNNRLI